MARRKAELDDLAAVILDDIETNTEFPDVLASPDELFTIYQTEGQQSRLSEELVFDSDTDLPSFEVLDVPEKKEREPQVILVKGPNVDVEITQKRGMTDEAYRRKLLANKEIRSALYNRTPDQVNPTIVLSPEVEAHIKIVSEQGTFASPIRRIKFGLAEAIKKDAIIVKRVSDQLKLNTEMVAAAKSDPRIALSVQLSPVEDAYDKAMVLASWFDCSKELTDIINEVDIPKPLLLEYTRRVYAVSESAKYDIEKTKEFILIQRYSEYMAIAVAIFVKIFAQDKTEDNIGFAAQLRHTEYFNPQYYIDKPFPISLEQMAFLYKQIIDMANSVFHLDDYTIERKLKQLQYFNTYQLPTVREMISRLASQQRRISTPVTSSQPQRLKRPSEVIAEHLEALSRLGDGKMQNTPSKSTVITIPIVAVKK